MKREQWDRRVAARLKQTYGVEPLGPDIPEFLDAAYRANKGPRVTAIDLAEKYKLEVLPSITGEIKP